jgi:hypothetical protein
MLRPRNVILLVADSLRYDSVHGPRGVKMPYTEGRALSFSQARAGGCWTLPATASLFTGMMPHQHGATSQTRGIRKDIPTLAEQMREHGYRTAQVTANVATTDIFGLDRGFEEMRRIWHTVPARHQKIHQLLVLAGKPRLRKKIMSRDFVSGKLSEDLDAAKVWLQSTCQEVFDEARTILRRNQARGDGSFLFLNVMETHFPYHMAPVFRSSPGIGVVDRVRELMSLYHLVNQTFLTTGKDPIGPDMLEVLRHRQRLAWEFIAPQVDAFIEELHADGENLVVFCSDHGDNFGEQGWQYHFSNVTDAGNRVPLFWLDPGASAGRRVDQPVSARDVYPTLLHRIGSSSGRPVLTDLAHESLPVMQAYWYNNQGRTLPQFKVNQLCFLEAGARYLYRNDRWWTAPPQIDGREPTFHPLAIGVDPVIEGVKDIERRRHLLTILREFDAFSARIAGLAAPRIAA